MFYVLLMVAIVGLGTVLSLISVAIMSGMLLLIRNFVPLYHHELIHVQQS